MGRVAISEQGGMTEGVGGDERIEGEMEVGRRQGREVFSASYPLMLWSLSSSR